MNDENTNPNQTPTAQAQSITPEPLATPQPITPETLATSQPEAQPIQTTVVAPQGIVAPPTQPMAAVVPGTVPTNIANPHKRRKLKIILIVAITLVLIIGGYAGFSFWTLQQNKKAANEKLDDVYSIVRDPNFKSSNDIKDLIFKEMGYNEFETNSSKLMEILFIAATLGITNSAKDVNQTDNYLGRSADGKLLGSREYDVKISDTQSSPIKLTLRVIKEGKNWELDVVEMEPTAESLLSSSGLQLPVKSGSDIQFNQ